MGRRRNRQSVRTGSSKTTMSEVSGSSPDVSSESELEHTMVGTDVYGSTAGHLVVVDEADSGLSTREMMECREGQEQRRSPVRPGSGDQRGPPATHRDDREDWPAESRLLASQRQTTQEAVDEPNPIGYTESSSQHPGATGTNTEIEKQMLSIMKLFVEQSQQNSRDLVELIREGNKNSTREIKSLATEMAQLREDMRQTRQPSSCYDNINPASQSTHEPWVQGVDRQAAPNNSYRGATYLNTGSEGVHQHSMTGGYANEGLSCLNQNCNYGNDINPNRHRSGTYTSRVDDARSMSAHKEHIKIPPFNGKETWKVWFNRFQIVAELEGWNERKCLQELLPKLQGLAGEFVFDELPRELLNNYNNLVEELECRFRVVESRKSFEAKFNRRQQKSGESCEDFAADLKRLYEKAHALRNPEMRRESLLRRFLNGLLDDQARFEVEYHKEPKDIDEAVYQVVHYLEARRRMGASSSRFKSKTHHKQKSNDNEPFTSDSDDFSDEEEDYRDKSTGIKQRHREKIVRKVTFQDQSSKVNHKVKVKEKEKDQNDQKTNALLAELWTKIQQIEQNINGMKSPQLNSHAQSQYRGKQGLMPASTTRLADIQCFGCRNYGHKLRDCPFQSNTEHHSVSCRDNPSRNNYPVHNNNRLQKHSMRGQQPDVLNAHQNRIDLN